MRRHVLYEDDTLVVQVTPSDEELQRVIRTIVARHGPLLPKEIKSMMPYLVSMEKMKKLLVEMIKRGELVEMLDCAVGLPEMASSYVPSRIMSRYKPLVPSKYMERWGELVRSLGGIKSAVIHMMKSRSPEPRGDS